MCFIFEEREEMGLNKIEGIWQHNLKSSENVYNLVQVYDNYVTY